MNEDELIQEFFREPPPDRATHARARARLIQRIEAEGPGRPARRTRRMFAVAATFVVFILVGSLITLRPFGGGSAAAADLRGLAATSVGAPALRPGPGQFVLWETEQVRPELRMDLTTGIEFTVEPRLRVETWIAPDGTGFQRTEVLSSEFASEADRELWEEAGEPAIPRTGAISLERFGSEDAPWVDLTGLPTEPEALTEAIREGLPVPLPTGGEELFSHVGYLLAQGNAGPELRAALFEVAARLEGVRSAGGVLDPLGREGLGFDLESGGEKTRLIFDPASSQLLAIELYGPGDGSPSSWLTSEPATIVDEPPEEVGFA